MTQTTEEGLLAFLTADAGVSSLCADRLYPAGGVPDDVARPYLTYRKVSGPREITHDGDAGIEHPRFQFSCWSDDYLEAKNLAKAVKKALSGYRGLVGDVPVSGCTIENQTDIYVQQERTYQVAVDVTLLSEEN